MKDLAHHKGHVQKKVLRQARREEIEQAEKKDWEEKNAAKKPEGDKNAEEPQAKKGPPVTKRRAREFH